VESGREMEILTSTLNKFPNTPKIAWWLLLVILSTGAIWQTRALHKDFVQRPVEPGFLLLAWLFWAFSFLFALGKVWVYTLPRQYEPSSKIVRWAKARARSPWFSAFSIGAFVMGVFSLWLFAYRNLLPNALLWRLSRIGVFMTFRFPIDVTSVVASTLAGGVVGFALVYFVNWLWRPRVEVLGWMKTRVNFGVLYKLRFRLKGRLAPGFCALQIEWDGKTLFAKWDETPNPLEGDDPNRFRAELVPATFYQPLFIGREYRVPIVIERDASLQVFSGWWFGWGRGYGPDPTLAMSAQIRLSLTGADLRWSAAFNLEDVVRSAS
jgi:hypothetical protein